jgi:hypothetical protein
LIKNTDCFSNNVGANHKKSFQKKIKNNIFLNPLAWIKIIQNNPSISSQNNGTAHFA